MSSRTSVLKASGRKPAASALSGEEIWARVRERAQHESEGVRAKVAHLVYESLDGRTLKLGIDDSGRSMAKALKLQDKIIARLIQQATGLDLTVEIIAAESSGPQQADSSDDFAQIRSIPVVKQAMEIFDASVIRVEDV